MVAALTTSAVDADRVLPVMRTPVAAARMGSDCDLRSKSVLGKSDAAHIFRMKSAVFNAGTRVTILWN
jgi:hypothetical protein